MLYASTRMDWVMGPSSGDALVCCVKRVVPDTSISQAPPRLHTAMKILLFVVTRWLRAGRWRPTSYNPYGIDSPRRGLYGSVSRLSFCRWWSTQRRNPSRRHLTANHPVIRTPPAATSWASCLFAVAVYNVG